MAATSSLRVCVVSEDMAEPFDEGMKKFAVSLLQGLAQHCCTLGLSTATSGGASGSTFQLGSNRLFLDNRLRQSIAAFGPDIICYIPSASCTFYSFLRCNLLKLYSPRSRVAMIALQPRQHSSPARSLIRFLRPDVVFAQSQAVLDQLRLLGCDVSFLASGVDTERFRPVPPERKLYLRQKYSLPPDAFLVLHVGHLKRGRNVLSLRQLYPHSVPLLVVGSTTGQERALKEELEASGVIVIDYYVAEIHELYQVVDCYLFPVQSLGSAIDIPLSVLEAMACNLPVIAYPFGGLPLLFEEGRGFWFAVGTEQVQQRLAQVKELPYCRTREMVEPYSWQNLAGRFLTAMEGISDAKIQASARPI